MIHIWLKDDFKTQSPVDRQFRLFSIILNNDNSPESLVNWRLGIEVIPYKVNVGEKGKMRLCLIDAIYFHTLEDLLQ